MTTWPHAVEAYETSDGDFHRHRDTAEMRQRNIDGAKLATDLLEGGASLGEAMRRGGFLLEGSHPELDEVYASTKLVISHWQCRDEAGYQPRRVTKDGEVFVFGHAGSWSGPYGANCSVRDVVYYWLDTKARIARDKERSNG